MSDVLVPAGIAIAGAAVAVNMLDSRLRFSHDYKLIRTALTVKLRWVHAVPRLSLPQHRVRP